MAINQKININKLKPLKIHYQKRKYKNNILEIIRSLLIPFINKNPFKQADIIQSNQFWGSWIGLIAAKLYNKKFILREGFQFYEFQTNLNKHKVLRLLILKVLSKYIYLFSDNIIVTSSQHKNYLIKMFNINKNKIYVIPNFVDTNLFKKTQILRKVINYLLLVD